MAYAVSSAGGFSFDQFAVASDEICFAFGREGPRSSA